MPITYSFDKKSRVLHTYQNGKISIFDFIKTYDEILADNFIIRGCMHVIHLNDINNWDVSPAEAYTIAERYIELCNWINIKLTIYIASDRLQFGISRMLSSLQEMKEPGSKMQIVDSEQEANLAILKNSK